MTSCHGGSPLCHAPGQFECSKVRASRRIRGVARAGAGQMVPGPAHRQRCCTSPEADARCACRHCSSMLCRSRNTGQVPAAAMQRRCCGCGCCRTTSARTRCRYTVHSDPIPVVGLGIARSLRLSTLLRVPIAACQKRRRPTCWSSDCRQIERAAGPAPRAARCDSLVRCPPAASHCHPCIANRWWHIVQPRHSADCLDSHAGASGAGGAYQHGGLHAHSGRAARLPAAVHGAQMLLCNASVADHNRPFTSIVPEAWFAAHAATCAPLRAGTRHGR